MLILPVLLALSGNVTIHPETPGVAVRHDPLGGVPLCVWNDSSVFSLLKPGMRGIGERVFRYPNGSTSNEYHWNGDGHFDADSVWVASDSTFTQGWVGETLHRGTSKNSYGFVRESLIDDGDTNTYWWSQSRPPGCPGMVRPGSGCRQEH
jgi:hypothetical protein